MPLIVNQKTVPVENIQYNEWKTKYQSFFGKGANGCDDIVRNSSVQAEEHLKTTSIPTNKIGKEMPLIINQKTIRVEDIQYNIWER